MDCSEQSQAGEGPRNTGASGLWQNMVTSEEGEREAGRREEEVVVIVLLN